ncbi:MAG: glycosyltransferase family 1 protein [Patescibacteria group bacterium]
MRIGFVIEPYETAHASGMGYVVLEFARELIRQSVGEHEIVLYSSHAVTKEGIPGTYELVSLPKHFLGRLWYFFTKKPEVDVLLFMTPLLSIVTSRKVKTVALCQELGSQKIPVEGMRPKLFAFFRDHVLMPLSLNRSAAVIVPSEATADDIRTYYPQVAHKLHLVPDGYQDLTIYRDSASEIPEAYKPYFFFAGKVKYRKNLHGIVSAFIRFKEQTGSPAKLVIAGDHGTGEYFQNMIQELQAHGLEQDVHFIGYTVGATLYSYYTNAHVFVFASLNEGFGMPILEAMHLGVPVITSSISSMAEVAGEAGLLVDPYSIEDMAEKFERMMTDQALRETCIARGKERAAAFSWERSTQGLLQILSAL